MKGEAENNKGMRKSDVIKAWGKILTGRQPTLSIEITRECPLRCPGCYAYEPEHLQEIGQNLRTVSDYKGDDLIEKILELVKQHKPLHLSLVGGEPLVRFRELSILLPQIDEMGISTQIVTSAVREIPKAWNKLKNIYVVVSVDGLQPEHDARRKPATYERILRNIAEHQIVVHCTITGQTANRADYYREFLEFWSARDEVKKIWFSLFTPQMGATGEEILTPETRKKVIDELAVLKKQFPKVELPRLVLEGYRNPPSSPDDCIFARTTLNYTANLENKVVPCQFGGTPDCSQCGCIASAGLAAVGEYKLFNAVPVKKIFFASDNIGRRVKKMRA